LSLEQRQSKSEYIRAGTHMTCDMWGGMKHARLGGQCGERIPWCKWGYDVI